MTVRPLTPSQLARVQYLTRAAGNGEEPAIEALKVIDELREETPVATEKLTDALLIEAYNEADEAFARSVHSCSTDLDARRAACAAMRAVLAPVLAKETDRDVRLVKMVDAGVLATVCVWLCPNNKWAIWAPRVADFPDIWSCPCRERHQFDAGEIEIAFVPPAVLAGRAETPQEPVTLKVREVHAALERQRMRIAAYVKACREDDTDRPCVQVFDVLARQIELGQADAEPTPTAPEAKP